MNIALVLMWPQPLAPVHSLGLSALIAALPLAVVLTLMGAWHRGGLFSSLCGLVTAGGIATVVWHMPVALAFSSTAFGFIYAIWPILWIVFAGLWLYNLSLDTGAFDLLRRWMQQHASGDPCVQAILVAFCFGALLEGCGGFGTPIAVTSFLLVGLGFKPQRAVVVSLIANTTPVAFGALGTPIVALAGVTGLELSKLSAMVGRQLPLISLMLPAYLAWVVADLRGLRRVWPAALVAGGSFALVQFSVSNVWGPYAVDILAALASIATMAVFLRFWTSSGAKPIRFDDNSAAVEPNRNSTARGLSPKELFSAWFPWLALSAVMVLWSYLQLFQRGRRVIQVPFLHQGVFITLHQKPYSALYSFEPLGVGTAVLAATVLTALCFQMSPARFLACGMKTARQLRLPGVTVMLIIGLAYLYNYSGMAYTLGAALARVGPAFPLVGGLLGWVACFLSGSDTASNVLFGNLQVTAAHQLHLNPVLLAATNSSGGVTGKMISPQNIAVGVTTVGLIGQEGDVLRSTFWHSILFAAIVSGLAFAQAYFVPSMVP